MTTADILEILKINLGICIDTSSQTGQCLENLLENYITLSIDAIKKEGATLPEDGNYSNEDGMLIMMYADYLYRKRAEVLQAMPRQLRYLLNIRVLSEKARND